MRANIVKPQKPEVNRMKILIFGASGRMGRELVSQALAHGDSVTAFVRYPAKFDIQHTNLKVVQGDAVDYASVERAVKDQDAVICALGSSTPAKRDPTLVDGVHNIIQAMEQAGVRRLVYLSFLAVRESRRDLGPVVNYVVAPLLHNVISDHEVKESLIKQSRLDWVIVRPPRLTSGRHTGVYRSGEQIPARSLILTLSRADLAEFMLKQLTDDTFVHKAPRVMY
jgi:putative NADH-flavin reductase